MRIARNETGTSRIARHTKTLIVGIVAIALVAIVGCAPKQVGSEDTNAATDASESTASVDVTIEEWDPTMDCSMCHTNEADSANDPACTMSIHAAQQCSNCHSDDEKLAKAHQGKSTTDRMPMCLKTTTVDKEVCLGCHNQDDLAEKTADVTALTDLNGTVVNPHAMPSNETHDQIVCVDCHSMHKEQTDLGTDAKEYCLTCHHADVFECYTCHEHS